ncbi:hypothetical protein CEUSTIGMA_g7231.t1 [Chlamydomonas eustigma]|uniref:Uncharacterized protein n=1 Tax=Chlamydomonas eustigma TaxID=1157962 RepID=A0A250X9M6_9CHLO|nr:hypothetical protein CEUSTIGMA_g7231.t1 [Chlamydomonas eustigma]|eukprot:GAX79791.1 hypothetical protein CEUSTIGMA_g7231.t1 [Chlamydomonas eustigma]
MSSGYLQARQPSAVVQPSGTIPMNIHLKSQQPASAAPAGSAYLQHQQQPASAAPAGSAYLQHQQQPAAAAPADSAYLQHQQQPAAAVPAGSAYLQHQQQPAAAAPADSAYLQHQQQPAAAVPAGSAYLQRQQQLDSRPQIHSHQSSIMSAAPTPQPAQQGPASELPPQISGYHYAPTWTSTTASTATLTQPTAEQSQQQVTVLHGMDSAHFQHSASPQGLVNGAGIAPQASQQQYQQDLYPAMYSNQTPTDHPPAGSASSMNSGAVTSYPFKAAQSHQLPSFYLQQQQQQGSASVQQHCGTAPDVQQLYNHQKASGPAAQQQQLQQSRQPAMLQRQEQQKHQQVHYQHGMQPPPPQQQKQQQASLGSAPGLPPPNKLLQQQQQQTTSDLAPPQQQQQQQQHAPVGSVLAASSYHQGSTNNNMHAPTDVYLPHFQQGSLPSNFGPPMSPSAPAAVQTPYVGTTTVTPSYGSAGANDTLAPLPGSLPGATVSAQNYNSQLPATPTAPSHYVSQDSGTDPAAMASFAGQQYSSMTLPASEQATMIQQQQQYNEQWQQYYASLQQPQQYAAMGGYPYGQYRQQ